MIFSSEQSADLMGPFAAHTDCRNLPFEMSRAFVTFEVKQPVAFNLSVMNPVDTQGFVFFSGKMSVVANLQLDGLNEQVIAHRFTNLSYEFDKKTASVSRLDTEMQSQMTCLTGSSATQAGRLGHCFDEQSPNCPIRSARFVKNKRYTVPEITMH